MSNKKVKVPLKGKMVDGEEIEFEVLREKWNEYHLKDGTKMRMKTVVTKVVRTEEYNQDTDEPIYVVNSQNILTLTSPDNLKRKVS